MQKSCFLLTIAAVTLAQFFAPAPTHADEAQSRNAKAALAAVVCQLPAAAKPDYLPEPTSLASFGDSRELSYGEARAKAVKTGRPVVVWVGHQNKLAESRLADCIHVHAASFPEAQGESIVVGTLNAKGDLDREDLDAGAGVKEIELVAFRRRGRQPASFCGPNGCSAGGSCQSGSCQSGACAQGGCSCGPYCQCVPGASCGCGMHGVSATCGQGCNAGSCGAGGCCGQLPGGFPVAGCGSCGPQGCSGGACAGGSCSGGSCGGRGCRRR